MMISNALDFWKQAANIRFSVLDTLIASSVPGRTDTDFFKIADEEISALLTVLSSFRMRRNRLSPVSRLPPELLARIFSFSAAIDTPSSQALGWIRVTHICSHWRRVALNHSALWANVSLKIGSRWADEMIQRAKLVPLIIRLHAFGSIPVSEMAVRVLHSHLGHTAELCLNGYITYLEPIAETLTASAPLLETVEISCFTAECVHLPLDLFGHHAPRLRSACFYGCSTPWSSPLLRNLSRLKINLSPYQRSTSGVPYLPSHEEFFDLLANMCQLESLSIDEYFPRYLPRATASSRMRHPIIKLPHLSFLKLGGRWSDCAPVLGSIEVPATSRIILDCRDLDTDGFNSMLLPIFARHSGKTGDALPMRTLLMDVDHDERDDTVINIVGWTTSDVLNSNTLWWDDKLVVSGIGLLFHICLCYSSAVTSPYNLSGPDTLKAILKTLHIQETSILCFGLESRAPEGYLSIFEQLESAQRSEHVACEANACSVFSSALAHTSMSEGGPIDAHDPAVPFPRLRCVKLSARSQEVGARTRSYTSSTSQVVSVDKLVEILERREALGVPLERLDIRMLPSSIYCKSLDQLRAASEHTVIEVAGL